MRGLLLPLAFALTPGALAAQTFGIPAGCTAFLTVQDASCIVAHYLTCANDPEGVHHRVDIFSDGYDFIASSGPDGEWLGSFDAYNQTSDRPDGEAANSVSITALLRGSDSYDFRMINNLGEVTRFAGTDTLTGERATIDGEELLVAATDITATRPDGSLVWSQTGTAYVHPELQLGFSGINNWVLPDDSYTVDATPVAFIRPGEPGFLSTVAQYGCAG